MNEELQRIYELMQGQGFLPPEVRFDAFSSKMEQAGELRKLYDNLAAKQSVRGTWEQFESKVSSGKKKASTLGAPASPDISGAPSSPATTPAPAAASVASSERPDIYETPEQFQEPSIASILDAPMQREEQPVQAPASPDIPLIVDERYRGLFNEPERQTAGREIDLSKFSLTGQEDPVQTAEAMREKREDQYGFKKEYEGKTVLRKANRDMANIAEFGTLARQQTNFADDQLKLKYGEDWMQQVNNLGDFLQQNRERSASNEWQTAAASYNAIVADPMFKMYEGGVGAQNKAFEEFSRYGEKHPEYKQKVEDLVAIQKSVDETSKGYPEIIETPGTWALKKGAQLLGGLATLPRTIQGAIPDFMPGQKPDIASSQDRMFSMMDEMVESANLYLPKPSQLSRPLYERIVPFEGKQVVVDSKGKPIEVRDKEGNVTVPAEPKEGEKTFEQRFNEAELPLPEARFNGSVAGTLDKTLDVAADLLIYRYLGRGTKPGVVMASMAMQHQQAYQEAIKEMKMSPADAQEYAFFSSLGTGLLEAYVGDIETKMLKPVTAEAVSLGKKEALAAAGKMSGAQRAMVRLKPVAKQVMGENAEEFLQSLQGDMTRAHYNDATGAKMEMQTTPEQLKETVLLTTLVTAPMAALGMGGYANQYRMSATMSAIKNPQKFNELLTDMALEGKITPEFAKQRADWAQQMSDYNATLPQELSQSDRAHVLALQDYRNEAQKLADDDKRVDALRNEARAEVKKADEIIGDIIKKATPALDATSPQQEAPEPVVKNTVEEEQAATVAENATVEPVVAESATTQLPQVNIARQDNFTPMVAEESVAAMPQESQSLASGAFFSDPAITVGQISDIAVGDDVDSTANLQTAVGDRITEAAVDMMARKGHEMDSKEVGKFRDFALQEFFQKPFIQNHEEHPAAALDRLTDEWIMEQGKIPMPVQATQQMARAVREVNNKLESLPAPVQKAANSFVADMDGDVERIAAAIDGQGQKADIELFNALQAENPQAAQALNDIAYANQSSIGGTLAQGIGEAGAVTGQAEEAAAEETNQGAASPQVAETEGGGNEAGVLAGDTVERAEALAETPMLDAESAAAVSEQAHEIAESLELPGEVSAEVEQTLREEGVLREGESAAEGVQRMADERAEEILGTKESGDYEQMVAARTGATALERPVFVETGTEFIVKSAPGQEDVLRELGAVPTDRGWSFPIEMKEAVMASMRPLNPTQDDLDKFAGQSPSHAGRNGAALRDEQVHKGFQQRKERIEKGKSLDERIRIAREELGTKEGAREQRVATVVERLSKAFPGVEVIMDAEEVAKSAKQAFPDAETPPVGFVYEGRVHVDMSRAGIDTPIHEFGHIWNTLSAINNPTLHNSGLEAIKGSEYEAAVREDSRYAHLSEEEILDEALALAIGERGARLMNLTTWQRFSRFLNDLWSSLRQLLGGDFHQFTAAEYADFVAAKLLDGKELMFETSERIAELEKQAKAMFVGEQAEVGEQAKQDLAFAQWLEEKGEKNTEIWMQTNWRRGVDGKWKFEIADDGAFLTLTPSLMENGDMRPLWEVLSHNRLYEAYPDIKNMIVVFRPMAPRYLGARMSPRNGLKPYILLNTKAKGDLLTTVLHEAQHEIQFREGFAMVEQESAANRIAKIENMVDAKILGSTVTQADIDREEDAAYEAYLKQAGEVEARNVEHRAKYSDAWRKQSYPPSTEDVAGPEQVVFFQGELIGAEAKVPGYEYEGETFKGWAPQARAQYGDNRLREAANKAAAQQLVDIEVAAASNKEESIGKIAQGLGLDESDVERMWDYAEANRAKPRGILDTIQDVKDTVAKAGKRQFKYGGLLPSSLFNRIKKMGSEIQATLYQMDAATKDLEKAMQDHFAPYALSTGPIKVAGVTWKGMNIWRKGTVPQEFRRHVSKVMKGEAEWDTLPAEIRPHVETMRSLVDDLSSQMLRAGVFPKNMVIKIMENMGIEVNERDDANHYYVVASALSMPPHMRSKEENLAVDAFLETHKRKFGTYLNRSYRIHSIPDWAKQVQFNRPVWDAAKRLYINMYEQRRAKLEAKMAKKEERYQEEKERLDGELANAEGTANSMLKDIEGRSEEAKAIVTKAQTSATIDDAKALIEALDKAKTDAEKAKIAAAVGTGLTPDIIADLDSIMSDDEQSALRALARQIRETKLLQWKLEREMAESKESIAKKLDSVNGYLGNIDNVIREVLLAQKGGDSALAQGGIPGRKELGITKKLKDIPPEVRALFGEYEDSIVNFTQTVVKMARLLHTQEFLNDMRDKYGGIYFFEGGNRPPGFDVQVSAVGNPAFTPLDGWFTSEDIMQGLQDEFLPYRASAWENFFVRKIINPVKLGKTVLNPQGIMRNFFGNPMLMFANAWNPKVMYDIWNKYSAVRNDGDKAKWREYSEELYKYGVRGESVHGGDIKDLQETLGLRQDDPYDVWFDKILWGMGESIRKAPGDIFKAASKAWEMGDEFWKIMGYESEKQRYAQAWFGKIYDDLDPEQSEAVRQRASHIARATVPTFSVVPRIVQNIRRNPFMGTFPAFPAEMMRITYNIPALALEEMKDPRTRAIGMKRMLGYTTSLTTFNLTLPYLLRHLYGWSEEKWSSLMEFVAPWMRNSELLPLGPQEGKVVRFVNPSYSDPFAWTTEALNAMMRDDDSGPAERAVNTLGAIAEPFLSPELSANTIGHLLYNVDDKGNKLRLNAFKEDISGSPIISEANLWRQFDYARRKMQPGFVKSAWDAWDIAHINADRSGRVKEWSDFLIGHAFGVNIERIDPSRSFEYRIGDLVTQKNEARKTYNAKISDLATSWKSLQPKLETMDDSARKARVTRFANEAFDDMKMQYEDSKGAYYRILDDAHDASHKLHKLGFSWEEIRATLKEQQFGTKNGEIDAIVSGDYKSVILKFDKKIEFPVKAGEQ